MRQLCALILLGGFACDTPAPVVDAIDVRIDNAAAVTHTELRWTDPTSCPASMLAFCQWLEHCAADDLWSVVGANGSNLSWNNCTLVLVPEDAGFWVSDPPDAPWLFGACQADVAYDFSECLGALEHAECGWSKTRHVLQILDHCRDAAR